VSTFITRFALLAVIAGLIVLAATGSLFSASRTVVALQLGAVALAVWARRSFPGGAFRVGATPAADTVIQRGPYRFIRHPMYAAALLIVWTAVVSHRSPANLAVGIVVRGVAAARIVLEERLLRARYVEYAAYVRATKAVVPFLL
jgi:protein-S-isoprenylcysteine O-methyltransferase Ste14